MSLRCSLPEDLDARLRLFVLSPITARLRSGALSEFVASAIKEKLDREHPQQETDANV